MSRHSFYILKPECAKLCPARRYAVEMSISSCMSGYRRFEVYKKVVEIVKKGVQVRLFGPECKIHKTNSCVWI